MDTQIIAVFCLCDDLLKALHHHEDPQCRMGDAEIMTTAVVAALHFRGNFEAARYLLKEQNIMEVRPPPLSSYAGFVISIHQARGRSDSSHASY